MELMDVMDQTGHVEEMVPPVPQAPIPMEETELRQCIPASLQPCAPRVSNRRLVRQRPPAPGLLRHPSPVSLES